MYTKEINVTLHRDGSVEWNDAAERKALRRAVARRKKMFKEQRLMGLGLLAISIGLMFVEPDATFAVMAVPMGLWMMFSRKLLIQ